MVEQLLIRQYNAYFPVTGRQFVSFVSRSVLMGIITSTSAQQNQWLMCRNAAVKKKLRKKHKFHQEYTDYISGLLKRWYAVNVPEAQQTRKDGRVWYIPHHWVYCPQKKKHRPPALLLVARRRSSRGHCRVQNGCPPFWCHTCMCYLC